MRELPKSAIAYIGFVSLAGLLTLAWLVRTEWGSPFGGVAFWLFAVFTILGEFRPIKAPLGNESLEITTSTAFAFALLLLAEPVYGALVYATATIIADLVARRAWWKMMFNATQYMICAGAAGLTFATLAGRTPLDAAPTFVNPVELGAAAVAAVVFFLLNVAVTGVALSLAQRLNIVTVFRNDFAYQAAANLGLLALGPIAIVSVQRSLLLLPVLLVPVAVGYKSASLSLAKEHQALHDGLTGLPNRAYFRDRADHAVSKARHDGTRVALMLVDLDRFKEVNDTLGHHMGDKLLRELGPRLQAAIGDGDLVARLGGDEFGVLLTGVGDDLEVCERAAAILRTICEPVIVSDLSLEIGASIGIAFYPDHGAHADTLIQRADVAMYVAKGLGDRWSVYSSSLDQHSPMRLALVSELRHAIDKGELCLHYQPKVSVSTGKSAGVEALVRWNHPVHGLIQPGDFISVAEQTGLIRNLTEFVLDEALAQLVRWQFEGLDLTVAVNVSARVLHDTDFPALVALMLTDHDVPGRRLVLELTESMIMADPERSIRALAELRALGVELSVDDYGTGHSSLAYLKRLPINEIKIDKSFITHMADDTNDDLITGSTIDLGRRLGLRVVAEGVESNEALVRLRHLGCDLAQGYYFTRPLPADKLQPWLDRNGQRLADEAEDRPNMANLYALPTSRLA